MRAKATAVLGILAAVLCAGADVVAQTPASPLRTVGVQYSETLIQTEVSVRIAPHWPTGGSIPARLLFTARYKGDLTAPGAIPGPPDELMLIVEASPTVVHVSTVFTLAVDGKSSIDLLAPGKWRAGSTCDVCGITSIRALLDPKVLVELAGSQHASANVLGMVSELDRADLDAIAEFARRIKVMK